MMDEVKNIIRVFIDGCEEIVYKGNYYIYREDYLKEGCVHFKDGEGKHHRIYNATVIIDEERN